MVFNSSRRWKSEIALTFLIGISACTSARGQAPPHPASVLSDYGMEDHFLLLSHSVKSLGMGRVGVTLREPRGHSENPALMATVRCFSETTLIPASSRLSGSDYARMTAVSQAVRISDVILPAESKFRLVLSYEYMAQEQYGIPYMTWVRNGYSLDGIETQGVYSNSGALHSLAGAVGYSGLLEGSFGLAYNWYKKGSLDCGFYLRCPFWRRSSDTAPNREVIFEAALAAGLSFSNSYAEDVFGIEQPFVRKSGATVDLGVADGTRKWLHLVAGYQRDDILLHHDEINVIEAPWYDPLLWPRTLKLECDGTGTNRFGIDLQLFEFLSLRWGWVDGISLAGQPGLDYWTYGTAVKPARGATDNKYTTRGLTISTVGLRGLLFERTHETTDGSSSLLRSFLRSLNLEFSYARIGEREANLYKGGDSYSITLMF